MFIKDSGERLSRPENASTQASNKFIDTWDKQLARAGSKLFHVTAIIIGLATIYGFISGDPRIPIGIYGGGTAGVVVIADMLSSYGRK